MSGLSSSVVLSHVFQLLDELTKELEELRSYKTEMEGRHRSHSQSPADLKMAHRRELEMKVVQLKEVRGNVYNMLKNTPNVE